MSESDTREKLLTVAARLFHEQGYAATGISTILREAKVNSGSLYYFFPTKEALLLGVLDQYLDRLEPEVLRPAFEKTNDPIERIFAVLGGYRQMLQMTGCAMGCPIGNLALELSDSYPGVREKLAGLFRAWCDGIQRCLDEAADRLPDHVDRGMLAQFVLTVMEGAMMQARAHRSLDPYDASMAHLKSYFDRLLAGA
ncbi:MAG: TetR/AcrR family transcriptional regulator [Phycisphaerales bacterium]|nr:TetR/AcrR family transcriptional regulator [Phycisphaerales bacterium]